MAQEATDLPVRGLDRRSHLRLVSKDSSETIRLDDYREKNRSKVRTQLQEQGYILSSNDQYTTKIISISDRLGVQQDTERVVLDSEYPVAAFYPSSKSVAFGRGVLRHLSEKGLTITEDHVAAILAHEIDHSLVVGDPQDNSFLKRVLDFQAHAEEHRADRMAMKRLAKAGYNPRAMIDVLRTVITDPATSSHPAAIDRLRHLETFLVNDSDPLSHTTKRYTQLPENMQDWVKGDSDFHKRTDDLLHMDASQASDELLNTTNTRDFLTAQVSAEHIRKVAHAKALVDAEPEVVDKLFSQFVVFEHLNNYHNSILSRMQYYRSFADRNYDKIREDVRRARDVLTGENIDIGRANPINDSDIKRSKSSREFRDHVPSQLDREVYAESIGTLSDYSLRVEQMLDGFNNLLDRVEELKPSPEFRAEVEEIKRKMTTMSVEDYAQEILSQTIKPTVELVREWKEQMIITSLRNKSPKPTHVDHFAHLVERDTGLPLEASQVLSETLFDGRTEKWFTYLMQQPKDVLLTIIPLAKKVTDRTAFYYSPYNTFHTAYTASNMYERPYMFNSGKDERYYKPSHLLHEGLELIQTLPATVLFAKDGKNGNFNFVKDLHSVNLSLDEWNLIAEADPLMYARERDQFFLQKYIHARKNNEVIDPRLSSVVENIRAAGVVGGLDRDEVLFLLENEVWPPEKTVKLVDGAIWSMFLSDNMFSSRDKPSRSDLPLLLKAYEFYTKHDKRKKPVELTATPLEQISSSIYGIFSDEAKEHGATDEQAFVQTLKQMAPLGIQVTYESLPQDYIHKSKVKDKLTSFSRETFETVNALFKENPNLADSTVRSLTVLLGEWKKYKGYVDIYAAGTAGWLSEVELIYFPTRDMIKGLLFTHGSKTIDWLGENVPAGALRDSVMAQTILQAKKMYLAPHIKWQGRNFYDKAVQYFTTNPDDRGKNSTHFPFFYHDIALDSDKWSERDRRRFWGKGKIAEYFPDIMRRRNPFGTLPHDQETFQLEGFKRVKDILSDEGSIYQKVCAQALSAKEYILFNPSLGFEQKIDTLTKTVRFRSVVRDIYLEGLLEEEWKKDPRPEEKIQLVRDTMQLFSENSGVRISFATDALRQEFKLYPQTFTNFQQAVDTVLYYLPGYSLARNHFLSQIEKNCSVTPDQLDSLQKLYVSPEGQTNNQDSAPWTYAVNQVADMRRSEKNKLLLWMTGLSSEKPYSFLAIEKKHRGHLNSFPRAVAGMTPADHEVFFKRLCLGKEGILDLELVDKTDLARVHQEKIQFLSDLSQVFLPDGMPKVELFRKLFVKIIDRSEPARASALMGKLFSKYYEAAQERKQYPPEEVVSLMLQEMGVVGKKAAQGIAELSWVPANYKQALRKSQEQGEQVSKFAQLELADGAGLIDGSGSIRIISFDEQKGAASNKQASVLTVEMKNPKTGEMEQLQVIGKFKRPSAQKTENIEHDLRILSELTVFLHEEGYTDALPVDFSDQIREAVTRELDFKREKEFSDALRIDLMKRNLRRVTQVGIPEIYFVGDDVVIESIAEGISLREYMELKENPSAFAQSEYGHLSIDVINQALFIEGLAQIVSTGNIHIDMHPGNIFINKNGSIKIIDLGMHEQLIDDKSAQAISLFVGLVTGNTGQVKKTLQDFGCSTDALELSFSNFKFDENAMMLLREVDKIPSVPREISSIIFALSKLAPFAKSISVLDAALLMPKALELKDLARFGREIARIGGPIFLARLTQAGGRMLQTPRSRPS